MKPSSGAKSGNKIIVTMAVLRLMAVIGVVVVILGVGVAALAFRAESATVAISLPVKHLVATSVVHGGLTGADFKTQRLAVKATKTAHGIATGRATVAATYATGAVVFTHVCGPQLTKTTPCQATPPVRAGNVVWNNSGTMSYVLLADVTCFCGESVSVRAWSTGPAGNAAPHTISLYVKPSGFTPFEWADNPEAVSGGAGATSTPVVLQSDVDAAREQLVEQVDQDLESSLSTKAGGLDYIADAAPRLTFSGDATGAHKATLTITASGALGATAFVDADVRALMTTAIDGQVPPGWTPIATPVLTDFRITRSGTVGGVVVTGTVTRDAVKEVSTTTLPAKLRGLNADAARRLIESIAPGSSVDIRFAPVTMPWLPFEPSHISVVTSLAPTDSS